MPDIDSSLINVAMKFLGKHDVVISPSDDGGYSLLGMNKMHKELFQNISWSSQYVLNETKTTNSVGVMEKDACFDYLGFRVIYK